MSEQLKENLSSKKQWQRLLFMLLIGFCAVVVWWLCGVVIVAQFLFSIITGKDNKKLRGFGSSASFFIQSALNYLTYNSEVKPFPFTDWPEPQLYPEGELDEATSNEERKQQEPEIGSTPEQGQADSTNQEAQAEVERESEAEKAEALTTEEPIDQQLGDKTEEATEAQQIEAEEEKEKTA